VRDFTREVCPYSDLPARR